MDILTNKTTESKDYISRYSNFPFYYHELDEKFIQGVTAYLSTDKSYVTVSVDQTMTLDALSNKYYGRPDYWWVIADFNRIRDPFIDLYPRYTTLKIPSITDIEYIQEV